MLVSARDDANSCHKPIAAYSDIDTYFIFWVKMQGNWRRKNARIQFSQNVARNSRARSRAYHNHIRTLPVLFINAKEIGSATACINIGFVVGNSFFALAFLRYLNDLRTR